MQNDAGGRTSARTDAYAGQIYALAAASRPGRNLLSKAYTYFYDEADEAGTTAEALGRVRAYQAALREAADTIGRDETGRFDAFRAIDGWRASVENLPCVGTIHFTSRSAELIERTGIWCPSFIRYEDRAIREKFTRIARASGKELWWYGCMGPKYPHPTYHIDDYLLSARVLGWMQYAYGIAGHLYWNAAGYTGWGAAPDAPARDVYTDPYRNGRLPAGDGFLFYPGRPFGADGPLPSLRLMSIRDGLEDYELLALAGEAAAASGATAEPLYDGLIDNVVYDPDEARFLRRHRQLLDYLDDPMRPLPAVRRPTDRLAGESERVLAAFAVSPDGTLCLSRCGASDGRAVEVYAVPPAEKWFTVTADLARLGIRAADRLSFTLKNFEARSLTVFVYLDGADGTFLCQSRELFENTSIAVDIPLSACPKGGRKLRLRVRNTYPREALYPVRVALGDLVAR